MNLVRIADYTVKAIDNGQVEIEIRTFPLPGAAGLGAAPTIQRRTFEIGDGWVLDFRVMDKAEPGCNVIMPALVNIVAGEAT